MNQFFNNLSSKFKSILPTATFLHREDGTMWGQLKTKTTCLDGAESEEKSELKRVTYGEKNTSKPHKTILLVGETGTGKSTLVDALINYVIGVEFDDKVRFTVVQEKGRSQSESQTSAVTVYDIYTSEDSSFPFALTIIDTPGYGDTKGCKYDKTVARTLHQLFCHEGVNSNELHAIGFVVKATENRLSDRQTYIFEAVISLFGKDMKNNIVALITHSDGGETDAIQALKDAKIPCAEDEDGDPVHFLFNNRKPGVTASKAKKKQEDALKYAWKTTQDGMKELFEFLKNVPTQKLEMTVDVLDKRIQIEALVTNYQDQIKFIELKQAERRQVEKALKEQKEGCAITVEEPYTEKVPINNKATICLVCKENCHYPGCTIALSTRLCEVMKKGHCLTCSGKCHHSKHVRENKKYVTKTRPITKTYEDLRKEYKIDQKDQRKVVEKEQLLVAVKQSIEKAEMKKNQLVEDSFQNILMLQSIALRGNSVLTYLYLDFLIEKIKGTGAADRDQKVQKLEEIKRQVETDKASAVNYLT